MHFLIIYTDCIQEYAYALSGNITDYHRINNFLTLGYGGGSSAYENRSESEYPKVQESIGEIRNFLNSFDFINNANKHADETHFHLRAEAELLI